MEIRVLGAHNSESQASRMVSLLIDGVLALDAGSITSSLLLPVQMRLKAVLLTHYHYDHIRDIPALAMNLFLGGGSLPVYATAATREALSAHLLNGQLYPDFFNYPPEKPVLNHIPVELNQPLPVEGYEVLAFPVNHASATAVGYQVSQKGKSLFYTGDMGSGLADLWGYISPQLLIIEVTMPNRYEDSARQSHHLTPELLQRELARLKEMKGYLPRVVAVHMNPRLEGEIADELSRVARSIHCKIEMAGEGSRFRL